MNRNLGFFIGVMCAALLAVWINVVLPGAGVIAFLAVFVFALIYTALVILLGKRGSVASKVKKVWKVVLDFFWGL